MWGKGDQSGKNLGREVTFACSLAEEVSTTVGETKDAQGRERRRKINLLAVQGVQRVSPLNLLKNKEEKIY